MSVADTIRKAREALGWSQDQLAEHLGVSRAAISHWETPEKTPKLKPKHIEAMARLFGMEEAAFTPYGGGSVRPSSGHIRIPLLMAAQVTLLRRGVAMDETILKEVEYLSVSKDFSKSCYALEIADDSMEPDFEEGEEIVIDPDAAPESDDDCVLVRLPDGSVIFRRYRARSRGAFDLVAESPDFPTISVVPGDGHELLGTLVEHRKRRRRKKN